MLLPGLHRDFIFQLHLPNLEGSAFCEGLIFFGAPERQRLARSILLKFRNLFSFNIFMRLIEIALCDQEFDQKLA